MVLCLVLGLMVLQQQDSTGCEDIMTVGVKEYRGCEVSDKEVSAGVEFNPYSSQIANVSIVNCIFTRYKMEEGASSWRQGICVDDRGSVH